MKQGTNRQIRLKNKVETIYTRVSLSDVPIKFKLIETAISDTNKPLSIAR